MGLDGIIKNIYQGFAYELRLRNELTHQELAQLTGLSTTTLKNIESHDKPMIARKTIETLAKFYGLKSVSNFMARTIAFNSGLDEQKPNRKWLWGILCLMTIGLIAGMLS